MNTNKTRFRWFSKKFASLCFGRKLPQHWKGLSLGRLRVSPEVDEPNPGIVDERGEDRR